MRQDIQCLRGVAIIFVILYHLSPRLFVNGFLGVDIFFVISGYLMAKNLTTSKLETWKDFVQFYYRRFRRILPLYYLTVFVSLILVHLYLGDAWWFTNQRYSLASLFLVTNQLIIHDSADYFREFLTDGSSLNAFIHLWSLGVEMQFYLLVPFIFFGLQFLKNDDLRLVAVSLTTLIGFIFFVFINQQFAFNFMLLRLWQFSAGFVALFWEKTNFYEISESLKPSTIQKVFPVEKDDSVTVCLSLLLLCLVPSEIQVQVLRPLVTLATAFVIASASRNNQFLQSKILAYIGDISYAMYLVHWPITVIFLTNTVKQHLFCIMIVLFCSVVLYHVYEKQYLRLGCKAVIPIIFVLILCNAYLQNSVREHSFWKQTYPEEIQDIVDRNKMMLPSYWETDPSNDTCVESKLDDPIDAKEVFGYCRYRGHGNISVMAIGNSYVMNLQSPIRSHFYKNYSDYRYYSIGEGYGFFTDSVYSQLALNVFKKNVERHRPDVLFILARYSESIRVPIQPNDTYLQQMNENIKFYEKLVKKIYILGSHPLYPLNFMNFFLQYIIHRPDELESLHLNRRRADDEMRNVKKRFSMVRCTKCHFFDLSQVFTENEKYLAFDRETMLSFIDNSIHLTRAGIKLCHPVFERVAHEIMNTS